MFTPKANSKQKKNEKGLKKRKNQSSDSTHGRAYRMHGHAAQCQATHTLRTCRMHGCAPLTSHIFRFFAFTVSRIKFTPLIRFRLRAPYTQYYLILQKNSSFSHLKITQGNLFSKIT